MEVPTMVTGQCAEIDVDRPAEAVPACKAFRLYALEIPQRIGNILEIETHAALQQAWPFATNKFADSGLRILLRSTGMFLI